MDKIELTKEELLEFAKMATFRLDDRLQPFSREQLRAEAWVEGYLFAKSHQPVAEQEEPVVDGLSGAGMILEERGRQIQELGYDDAHDRQYSVENFVMAAMAYLDLHKNNDNCCEPIAYWPFDPQYFKPRTLERDLVKAGALIAAAIDRLNQKED